VSGALKPPDTKEHTMTSIEYRVASSDLLGVGWADAEVDYYADKLARLLVSKLGHIGHIEVRRVDGVTGMRPVRIDTDDLDLNVFDVETRILDIANNVFDVVTA
jgi:hypothetical protein